MKKNYIVGAFGTLFIALAIFAEKIGLDNDIGWGRKRIILAVAGVALVLINFLASKLQNNLTKLTQHFTTLHDKYNRLNYLTRLGMFALIANIIVISFYLWIAQPSFNDPTSKSNYYSRMTIAFKNKQLDLMEKPPVDLLSLNNPYDYNLRDQAGVFDFPWDVSLYKDKFYFYWGPAPSLLLIFLPSQYISNIYDRHIALLYACGLFFYMTVFTIKIWRETSQHPPAWVLGICLLAVGLSAPTTWMLRNARIYEAAIFAGQFFLIGGFYWVYTALHHDSQKYKGLFLGSLHWAFALATRFTLLPAIVISTLITILLIIKYFKTDSTKTVFLNAAILLTPMIFSLAAIAWYNWIRFDSPFEFGIRYQLANVDYTRFTKSFSSTYISDNLYNYFIYPIQMLGKFPYLTARENVFSNERLAGLIYTSPYILLASIPVFRLTATKSAPQKTEINLLNVWLPFTIGLSFVITLTLMLSFYFPALRYAEDFMPLFLLINAIIFCREYRLIGDNERIRKIIISLLVFLALSSIIVSSLIALPDQNIRNILFLVRQIAQSMGF